MAGRVETQSGTTLIHETVHGRERHYKHREGTRADSTPGTAVTGTCIGKVPITFGFQNQRGLISGVSTISCAHHLEH